MSVDLRTRWDDAVPPVDGATFFGEALPELIAAHPDLVDSTDLLDLRPITVVVDGAPVTLRRGTDGAVVVETGAEAAAQERWTLTAGQVADLVTDQVTPVGLMTAGDLHLERGRIARVMDWWLVLRSVLDGRPVFRPGSRAPDPDLERHFTLADDPAVLRAFLERHGFLHLRGTFSAAEMERIGDDMDRAAPDYRPDDGRSWWATLADGTRRVVRMQHFHERSDATAALLADDRMDAIRTIPGLDHEATRRGNRIEALFKPVGVTEGISDVPWHKDCSLGRHSYQCCSLTVGISVTGAGPSTGQLRVVPGSHRELLWPSLLDPAALGLPDHPLPTRTGDVTVHLSCTLHRAEPPTVAERKVLYTGFTLPARDPEAAAAASGRLYRRSRERAPLTTSRAAAPAPNPPGEPR